MMQQLNFLIMFCGSKTVTDDDTKYFYADGCLDVLMLGRKSSLSRN